MFNEKISYSLGIVSRLIDNEIVYTVQANFIKLQKEKSKKVIKHKKRSHLVCICLDQLVSFNADLNKIKKRISFENIASVDVDVMNEKILKINLLSALNQNEIKELTLSIENRTNFLEKLSTYITIHHSQKNGKFVELQVNYLRNIIDYESFALIGDKITKLFHDARIEAFHRKNPGSYNALLFKNYMFYLKKGYQAIESNFFKFEKSKESNEAEMNAWLIVEASEALPIEHLNANGDLSDFPFNSYYKFFTYMYDYFGEQKFWCKSNSPYIKKYNYSKDQASWEGWKIECRTKPKKGRGLNFVFIFLRRKYIPPLFETYQDFDFILFEEYIESHDINISPSSNLIVEMAADTLTPEEMQVSDNNYHKLIRIKLDGFLMDADSYDFFINNLKIWGRESYKLGLAYVLKMVLILEHFVREKVQVLKEKLLQRITDAYIALGETDFSIINYEKLIKYTEIDKLTNENDIYYINFFRAQGESKNKISDSETKLTDSKVMGVWEDKRSDFFVFCINGGLTYKLLNLEMIVSWLKRIPELRIIHFDLNKLLNIRVVSQNDEIMEPTVNTVLNNMYNIKEFSFNEKIMTIMIENDYLRTLQEVESEVAYVEFLKYLLENHYSNKLLSAVYFYLKIVNKGPIEDSETSEGETPRNLELSSNIKKCLGELLPTIHKIYANVLMCPTVLTIACKCLIILANFDKFNKTTLIAQDCLKTISSYLCYPDEKLAYFSGELLSIVITETRDSIKDILNTYPKLLSRCLKFFRGTSIPGCYYSSKTVLLANKIINILLNMQNAEIKEKLCHQNYRKFVKYLFNYLQENQATLPMEMEQTLYLQEKIYDILGVLVNKNTELRRYMEDYFRILKLIDFKCNFYCQVIDFALGNTEMSNINIVDHHESYLKLILSLMKFLKKFISNDLYIVKLIILNCLNISKLVSLVYENSNRESIKLLGSDCKDLFKILFQYSQT